jgi:hypothetical protein
MHRLEGGIGSPITGTDTNIRITARRNGFIGQIIADFEPKILRPASQF